MSATQTFMVQWIAQMISPAIEPDSAPNLQRQITLDARHGAVVLVLRGEPAFDGSAR